MDNNELFYADDINNIKVELKKEKPKIPCNIWGYIKDLEARILKLEEKEVIK